MTLFLCAVFIFAWCWQTWSENMNQLKWQLLEMPFFFQLNEKAGPSLMTTVAMPVFSTKNETVSTWAFHCLRLYTNGPHISMATVVYFTPLHSFDICSYLFFFRFYIKLVS